jgi:hypothetical protein
LGVYWDLTLDFQAMVLHARIQFNYVIFREVFIIGCWSLWCHRNDIIFDAASYLSQSGEDFLLVNCRQSPLGLNGR